MIEKHLLNIKDFHPYLLRLSCVLLLLGVDGGVAAAVLLLGPLLAVPHAPLGVCGDLLGSCIGLELAGGELTLEQQQPSEHRLPRGWKLNLVVLCRRAHMPPHWATGGEASELHGEGVRNLGHLHLLGQLLGIVPDILVLPATCPPSRSRAPWRRTWRSPSVCWSWPPPRSYPASRPPPRSASRISPRSPSWASTCPTSGASWCRSSRA